jgi:hypothetical protein
MSEETIEENDVKEDIAVDDYVESNIDGNIKEVIITLNTLTQGSASATTDVINGFLECIIINSDKPIQVLIQLDEYPDIYIYSTEGNSIAGTKYLSVRTEDISKNNERFNMVNSKWVLNNKIKCTIQGGLNTTANIVLRYH